MPVGTNAAHPPLLLPLPPTRPRPLKPVKRPVKPSLMAAATRGKRPR